MMHWKTMNRSQRPITLVVALGALALAGVLTATAGGAGIPREPSLGPAAETATVATAAPAVRPDDYGYSWASAGGDSGYLWSSGEGWTAEARLGARSGWLHGADGVDWSDLD